MNRAGLNPSAAMTRGMTDTQAAMVNSRWFRHSAAGVRLAAADLTRACSGPASQEISGGQSRKLRWRSGAPPSSGRRRVRRAAVVRAAALARSEVGQRFPSSWHLNNSGLPCEPRTVRPPGCPWTRRRLRRAALRPGGLWHDVEVVARTGSTNADLLARALARRAGRRGARRRGAERGPRPDGPLLGVAAARRADVLPAGAPGGGAARPARLAAAAHRGGRRRGGDQRDGSASHAEVAERRAGRPRQARRDPGRGVRRRGRRRRRPQRVRRPGRTAAARPGRAGRDVAAHRRPGEGGPGKGAAAHRDPGRLRALVPGLAAGRGRPGPLRAARRVHPAVRHDRPPGPGRTPRRSGALRAQPSASTRMAGCWSASRRAPSWPVAAGDVVHLR